HVNYWGDVHLKNLGAERGNRISPVKDALDLGLVYNFHTDTPVVKPDMLHTVWTAVNRISRNGVLVGADQRVGVYDALKGVTINAAYAYFEEDEKGSIKVGKRADLVVLSDNPLKVDPMAIKDIKVLETIKDGQTVYRA
ncbi:MAG: amidohydrolase family protein, partial [Peptococcaceae bacterium]